MLVCDVWDSGGEDCEGGETGAGGGWEGGGGE